MKTQQDLIALFKQVATEVDKREFRDVTGESVITELGIDSLSMMQIVGSPATVGQRLQDFVGRTRADELIVAGMIFDHAARLRSYELTAAALRGDAHPAASAVV